MKNLFKKLTLVVLVFVAIALVISCETSTPKPQPQEEVNAPVFHGVEDVTIEKGESFSALAGVSVTDVEDGEINLTLVSVDARSVNTNVEGEYIVTYVVYDNDGNMTKVERKVTVVFIDREKPTLYGVADCEIALGDPVFSELENVSAVDTIDGEVEVKVTGSVNVWAEGEYQLHYEAQDAAGNKAEALRTVKVSKLNFEFGDAEPYEDAISGGLIIPTIANYSLVQFKVYANHDALVKFSLEQAEMQESAVQLAAGEEAIIYARFFEALENAELSFEFVEGEAELEIDYVFAGAGDHEAPQITRTATGDVYVPVGADPAFALSELLRGITAEDNIDGNVTANLQADLSDVNFAAAGEYDIAIVAKDSLGNEAQIEVKLVVAAKRDTHTMTDPGFENETNDQIKMATGSGGVVSAAIVDGEYVLTITTAGGWASGDSPYLSGVTTAKLEPGHYYMFEMDAKALVARTIQIRAGLELWADPWIENFRDTVKYQVGTEYQKIQYIFYLENATSSVGSNVIKFEIQCGSIYWAAEENNNVLYFDNMQFYLLSNDNKAPEISVNEALPTTFAVGAELPDFKTYFEASDLEDGAIALTDEMLNLGGLSSSAATGKYTVTLTVKDSAGQEVSKSIEITLIASADTEAPVISVDPMIIALVNSLMPIQEGTDLSGQLGTFIESVTISDNVDGDITPTLEMIDFDGFNYNSANVGEFTLKLVAKDSSGNESDPFELQVTVIDGNPPKLVGVKDTTVMVGQTFNPLTKAFAYDSADGVIAFTLSNITGLEAFLNTEGKVVGAAGAYQVGYSVKDAAGNEAFATVTFTVIEAQELTAEIDLLAKQAAVSGGSSKSSYEDGVATIDYVGGEGWWASYVQLKYYGVQLQPGKLHKLVITAKAELAREINIYFVDGDSNKIPGFNVDNNKLTVSLAEEYTTFEYYFTPESASSTNSTFELDFAWEDYLLHSGISNTIEISELKILSVAKEGEDPNPGTNPETPSKSYVNVATIDFEDGAGSGSYVNPSWKQEYYSDGWVETSSKMNSRVKGGSNVTNIYSCWSMTYMYTYTFESTLEDIACFKMDLGNYYSAADAPIKVVLVDDQGQKVYVVGSADAFETMGQTTDMDIHLLREFEAMKVAQFYIVFKSAKQGDAYVYLDNIEFLKEGEEQGGGEGGQPEQPAELETRLLLDFEDSQTDQDYNEAHWKQEKYTSQWETVTGQMRSRGKDGSRVVNMFSGYSMTLKYTYTPDAVLENVTKVSFDLGNYFTGAIAAPIKVALVLEDNSIVYLLGDASNFYSFPVTTALEAQTFTLENAVNVKAFYVSFKSSANSAYIYLDNLLFAGPKAAE